MIRKAKSNGRNQAEATEPEIVYCKGEGLPEHLVSALDASASGPVHDDDRRIEAVDVDSLEAATMAPRDGTTMLYIGIPMPGRQPPCHWYPTARYDQRRIGSHPYIEARPIRTDLGARQLAALEVAHNRNGLELYGVDQHPHAEPVTPEAAAMVTLGSGSRILHVKFNGLWFGVTRFHKTEPAPSPEPAPPGGEAYPRLSIA